MMKPDYLDVAYQDLEQFQAAMQKEYARHYPEKRETWKTMPIGELETLLWWAWDQFSFDENTESQLVDIANLCAMLWTRKTSGKRTQEE